MTGAATQTLTLGPYDYGEYRKVRVDKPDGSKTFYVEHDEWDDDGRHRVVRGRGGAAPVLYRLDALRADLLTGDTVYITEGEKDCDRLVAGGDPATTAGGASEWRPEFAAVFAGTKARIAIVQDKDDAGRAAAQRIYADLRSVGLPADQLRIVEAAGDESINDLSDHLDAGFTVSELVPVEPTYDDSPFTDDRTPAGLDCLRVETFPDPFRVEPMRWDVEGLIPDGTHGEIAGAEKTLKSYVGATISVGATLGTDVFGQFPVPRPLRTLMLVGEGGRNLLFRRIERIAQAYGAAVADLRDGMRFSVETASVSSSRFRDTITEQLDVHQPDLVFLDPWYAYAATDADARNLYETGRVLNDLRAHVCDNGASLVIANHFNQTGTGTGLQRITMAGHAEWCDSWWLVNHRQPPNVDAGQFWLTMNVGSRQWGGSTWNIDYTLGPFDQTLGAHVGEIEWRASRDTGGPSARPNDLAKILELIPRAVAVCREAEKPLSQRALCSLMGRGTDAVKREAVDLAVFVGCLEAERGGPNRATMHTYARAWRHEDADRLRAMTGEEGM